MKLAASWKQDCCGKEDYDGIVVEINSRFWPQGGSHFEVDTISGTLTTGADRPWIKPSAKSSLLLYYKKSEQENDYKVLATKEFEAETEEEVKKQVEEWAEEQYSILVELLMDQYNDTILEE